MEAIKCKICGERHYGLCAFSPQEPPAHPTPVEQPVKKRNPRGTFDRTAYQRELMRKRRAAKRESKT